LFVLRWLTRLCAGFYLLALVAVWLLFRYVGEQNLTLAYALYLPPSGWGLPLFLIVPIVLVFDWKSLALVAASVAVIAVELLGLEWHAPKPPPAGAPVLTVLTFNRGESVGSLEPFKNAMQPDVLLLQDANGRADHYSNAAGYEEFKYGDNIGQFMLASRFPITGKELIADGPEAVAARFTIDWQGKPVVIYSMHLPTPRAALGSLNHGAFLWGIIGVSGRWAAKRATYESWWQAQIHHSQVILERVRAETLPCIVAGDSNAPAQGYVHHLFTRLLADSHEAAGSGCGLSFPGTTHSPLSLGGPWMRIDKIFSSSQWLPLWNKAEPDRPSQHRAVAAAFALPAK
jgi:endonuclease/exonuclease/phosphatase (EEP) superfamily protein YafD